MDESRSAQVSVPRVPAKGTDPLIGRVINERYRIINPIARGGMGAVYLANQAPLGRRIALKVLDPSYKGESDPEFHKRFFLEASTAAKLTHPNTVTIFDYGKTDDEIFYIAMELLEGRTLHRALRDEGAFNPDRAAHIARQICRSLREAHELSVIHRDLKPANVYLVQHGDEDDFVKVLDFGLVKNVDDKSEELTHTGVFMGSPKYMSPEQIRGEKVDLRVDIYALGVMLFEMLTGRVPYDRPNSVNILMAHLNEPIPTMEEVNPDVRVPVELEDIVRTCLAKKPEQRFSTMGELLVALTHFSGLRSGASGEYRLTGTGEVGTMDAFRSRLPSSATQMVPPSVGQPLSPQSTSGMPIPPDSTWTAVPFAQASKPAHSAAPLFLAGIFALTGIGGFFALSHPFDTGTEETATTEGTPAAGAEAKPAVPVVPAKPVAENRKVVVSLHSNPEGATVYVGDKKYGPTPAHVVWTGADAELGREVTFRFQLKGYRDASVTQQVGGARLDVEAPVMEALTGRRPPREGAAVPGAGAPKPPAAPAGASSASPAARPAAPTP